MNFLDANNATMWSSAKLLERLERKIISMVVEVSIGMLSGT
jgi:hypothetical protein